ncbi:MAG: hypothetical protein K2L85_01685 [Paramuribaculum sp.]|nr:hypothetical protein [Paramuribaculum sp.]
MKKAIFRIFAAVALLAAGASCADDFLADDYVIPEGEAVVSATVDFHPLVSTEVNTGGSRAAGDALKDLEDIAVFAYNNEGKLLKIYSGTDLVDLQIKNKNTSGSNTAMPDDAGGADAKAEESTARATFTLKGVPFGRYYFYAVANMGRQFTDDEETREAFSTIDKLRNHTVEWNKDDVSKNDQMFGYFTDAEDDESGGFEAPAVTVSRARVNLHAWIKRAASKITVVFDGSGLHDNIWIYVKSVTVKDIPRYCKIGSENWVKTLDADSMIVDGGTINYNAAGALPEGTAASPLYQEWLEISKGSGLKGAVTTDKDGKPVIGADGKPQTHSEYAEALYFYENLQGNYPDDPKYDKRQDWDKVGYMPRPGEDDYKDNIPYGTYIEVEAYYNSENATNVSRGRIIYRFMLGENETFNYNASRNNHYQVTLGFKGYANQPDWHIAYVEPDQAIYADPTYYVSYMYNQKAIFPVRIKGDVQKFSVEIVENNWAPFDSIGNNPTGLPEGMASCVPPAEIGSGVMDFKWNRDVYVNAGKRDVTVCTGQYAGTTAESSSQTNINNNGYFYGLQKPYSIDGKSHVTYSDAEIKKGAPRYATPIWAGFLALNVPDQLDAVLLPNSDYRTGVYDLKDYFYNQKQNYRELSLQDLTFTSGQTSKTVGTGNNQCEITKAPDGSITVHFPMWTRPKSMLGISGFSGNNPYDTYQRRAVVKITATYKDRTIVKYMPVFQVRRVVNPKAVWHQWNDTRPFNVKLLRRLTASADEFTPFDSEGGWRAYVKTWSDGDNGFITLTGGDGRDATGAIVGSTGTPIDFTINFNGTTGSASKARCAIIQIEYHGLTCYHSIFVRQGYNQPLDIAGDGVKWSSFALFSCDPSAAFGTQWDAAKKNYVTASLTKSPLALGTMFKRGNYNGVLVVNNDQYGVSVAPGTYAEFSMSNGGRSTWRDMEGYPYSNSYGGWSRVSFGANSIQETYAWGRFKVDFDLNGIRETRHYRVPTVEEYTRLQLNSDYGIGVMYGDGATGVATKVDDAYCFEDYDNDGNDNISGTTGVGSRGMRGVIVFNTKNAHQLFFPVGARGVGRRTITGYTQNSYAEFGQLRYSSVLTPLTGAMNSYRPIPYNMPAAPGALYWFNKPDGSNMSWDCNYFDMNFTPYSFPTGFTPAYSTAEFNRTHGGDALPIKLVLDE